MNKRPLDLNCLGALAWELLQPEGLTDRRRAASLIGDACDSLGQAIGLDPRISSNAEPSAKEQEAVGLRPQMAALISVLRSTAEALADDASAEESARVVREVAELGASCVPRHRVIRMLEVIGQRAACNGCGQTIWFVKGRSGKVGPWTREGLSHFADCPQHEQFRKAAPAEAEGKATK